MKFICENIHKSYGRHRVLKGIRFEASGGDIVCFYGDNGCGKSTLLSILAGCEKPDEGDVSIDGKSIFHLANLSGRIGYVPQSDPLPGEFRVGECIRLWSRSRRDLSRIASEYDLEDILRYRISALSGGMRRRVSIACAEVSVPDIMIFDEPTAALDMHYKSLIRSDILRLADNGKLVIMVSHDRDEIDMCNARYHILNGINEQI